jgi:ATP-dependent Clp protease protease subunit
MKKFLVALALMLMPVAAHAGEKIKKMDLSDDRLIVFRGEVDEALADATIASLVDYDKTSKTTPIFMVINSPGGDVGDGFRIISAMEATDAPIHCVVDANAASMAAIIFEYCDKRYVEKHSKLMFHQASLQLRGPLANVKSEVDHFSLWIGSLEDETAKKMGMTPAAYRAKAHDEWWLTATEAQKAGVSDGIVEALKYKYTPPPAPAFNLFGLDETQNFKVELK